MFLKNLTIVLALFAVAQGLPSKPTNKEAVKPLYEEIRALVESLGHDARELSHRSNDIMTYLKEFKENSIEMEDHWFYKVRPELDTLAILIDETNQTANEQDVDITSCIDALAVGIQPILFVTSKLLHESVPRFKITYRDMWLRISYQITEVHAALDHNLLEAWNCDNDECLKDILKSIQDKLQTYIEGELSQLIEEAADEIKPEGEKILTEGYQLIDMCVEVLRQNGDDFIDCAKELMG